MPDLSDERLAELTAICKKATPGPWIWPKQFNGSTLWANRGSRLIVLDAARHGMNSACLRWRDHGADLMVKAVNLPGDQSHPDKDYIAAFSPDVMLAMVEELQRRRSGEVIIGRNHAK